VETIAQWAGSSAWRNNHVSGNRAPDFYSQRRNQVVASSNLVRPVTLKNKMAKKIDVTKHKLVPVHTVVSEAEKKKINEKYNLSGIELPRIYKEDPAIAHLKVKPGDIIKIIRKSSTAGQSVFYRRVTSA